MSISDTLELLGIKTLGGMISFEKLVTKAPLPCIIHWKSNHFIVLYKIEKNKLKNYLFG